jgi:uncharacterized membrane protein YeaQ/YmgE (transglycosylase-associated protein family)
MACEDPNAPLFFACHLEGEGTVSEDRNKDEQNNTNTKDPKDKNPQQAAGIINAGANGLDSITGFIGSFMGNTNTPNTTYVETPAPKSKTSPWLIGGVIGGVVLLIALLIFLKNGKPTE